MQTGSGSQRHALTVFVDEELGERDFVFFLTTTFCAGGGTGGGGGGTGLFEASRNSPQCGEGGTVNIGALVFKYVADVLLGLLAALMAAWFAAALTRPRRKAGGLDPRRRQLGLQVRRDDLTAPAGAARKPGVGVGAGLFSVGLLVLEAKAATG